MKRILAIAFMAATAATTASAATVAFGPTTARGSGPNVTFSETVIPSDVIGDATFMFSVRGDLDWSREFVDVSVDGFSLGRVFDNNSGNDAFDFARDRGNQHRSTLTGTATIANSVFAGLISDGALEILFNFSSPVNYGPGFFGSGPSVSSLSGEITYTAAIDNAPAPVPLPATFGLMGLGLLGLGAVRRKKKAKS